MDEFDFIFFMPESDSFPSEFISLTFMQSPPIGSNRNKTRWIFFRDFILCKSCSGLQLLYYFRCIGTAFF